MRRGIATIGVLLVGLLLVGGCASWQRVTNPPGFLLTEGRHALEEGELETAYDRLAEVHRRYPDSPEDREAFVLAASIFKHRYHGLRFSQPDARWFHGEAAFLFDWLDGLLAEGAFPRQEAEALWLGLPYGEWRAYLAHREARGAGPAGYQVLDDNGLIEEIVEGDARP